MDRFDPFVKYADVYGDIINWEKDPMNKPQNQNKYFFSDGKTYYEQICKMLRLMSVFNEAFNQIYSNEDEISEAWENFVNNLSASVVEGSEPDVTLTWTDDSVNFEFTMVPGVPGEQGVGITSISFNSDYTMTITLSDGNTYTSMSLKGETGPQGPQGETGSGLQILDVYATLADLQSAHPTGQPGDAYQVGSAGNYTLYIWSSSQSAWVPAGSLGTVSPSTSNPLMDGTASAGSSNLYSRGDHVHPSDTSRASKEELDALIRTSQSLIDQSFTYRKSPAIQDGLARIDKIKGNTLVWNQLIQKGNMTDGWTFSNSTGSYSDNVLTFTATAQDGFVRPNLSQRIISGHKYLGTVDVKGTSAFSSNILFVGRSEGELNSVTITTSWQTFAKVFTNTVTENNYFPRISDRRSSGWDAVQVRNCMLIDLTQMFGAGNEPTSAAEFVKLYPLPYYQYEEHKLLSFNGTGIKTVGFNQWDEEWEVGSYTSTGIKNSSTTEMRNKNFIPVLPNTQYYFNSPVWGVWYAYDDDKNLISRNVANPMPTAFVTPSNCHYINFYLNSAYGTTYKNDICINISSSKNGTYEPYKTDSLSLPIAQYFPSGMRSAGNAYDEITSNNAITRMGAITFDGTQTRVETYVSSTQCRALYSVPDILPVRLPSSQIDDSLISNYLLPTSNDQTYNGNAGIHRRANGATQIMVSLGTASGITTVEAWNAYLSAHPLTVYYPLATPVESAVDLDLDFMAYEDGTEQLLPVNGPAPSTSPIIADMTYLSIDDAMEYILDKLANVPQNTQQILESLEDDVADLQTDVGALQPAVSALQTSVGNINTNIGQLSSTVAGHTASISDMQSDITDLNTGLSNLEDTVTDNTSRIGTLESGLSATNGNVQNLETSVSDLDDTVTAQGTTVTALDSIIQDISNNPVVGSLGSHELGFVAAYVSATLAANTGTKVTIPKPAIFPNNYTPLFIVGMTTGSYNVSICEIPYSFGNRDSVDCRVWNHGGQQTTQITVYILCMRQRQSQ